MNVEPLLQSQPASSRLWRVTLLFCVELVVLAASYQFFSVIECQQTGLFGVCRFLRSLVARALVVFAAFAVLAWARPQVLAGFRAAVDGAGGRRRWVALHLAGVGLLLLPLGLAPDGNIGAIFHVAVWPMALGSLLAGLGGLLWLAPAQAWRGLVLHEGGLFAIVLAVALVLPDIAEMAQGLWDWQVVTQITFEGVHWFLRLFADTVIVDAAHYNLGFPEFNVNIAPQCSGVEGMALVAAFTLIYAFIFRDTVRFPQFWIVLPLAVALSWIFNIVRIGTLIWIGREISPNLAVNGFHSYAGWLAFTLLALGIIWIVQAVPWLHRRAPAPTAGLRGDRTAALLVPFAAFMLASLLCYAFFPHPELGYPLRVLAMAAALWFFRSHYRQLDWRADPLAIGVGIAVAIGWIVLDQRSGEDGMALAAALAPLPGWAFAVWLVARLAGTVLLVPLVEELAFRGYLLGRLDGPGLPRRVLAVVASTAAFATLHGRWLEAGVAGLAFALLTLRHGRISDAVVAHLVANLIIALWALAISDFTLI